MLHQIFVKFLKFQLKLFIKCLIPGFFNLFDFIIDTNQIDTLAYTGDLSLWFEVLENLIANTKLIILSKLIQK